MTSDPRLLTAVQQHPYPLLFATISGAHLYGFPSLDSDYDLRGVHVLPAREVLGLHPTHETIERETRDDGLELDLVTHDIKKFFGLLLKKNGYVLEQLYSPLVVHTTPEHEELKAIARGCVTRHHAHHYLGFAATQWKLFKKERPRRVKPLLYVYRVLLTGIHLMRAGGGGGNPVRRHPAAHLPPGGGLLAPQLAGPGHSPLAAAGGQVDPGAAQRRREAAARGRPDRPEAGRSGALGAGRRGRRVLPGRVRAAAGGAGGRAPGEPLAGSADRPAGAERLARPASPRG